MFKLVMFLIYILLILTVLFMERKKPTEAVLWVLVLICIPYVGILLYIIFGSTISIKMTAFFRRNRLKEKEHLLDISENIISDSELSEEDMQVIHFNNVYNKCDLTSYNDISIYTDGVSHYEQLFEDIQNAQSCIFIEYYTIHNDRVGQALAEALTEKAKQGVRVLVLMDYIANLSTPAKMFEPLQKSGGLVIRIKPYLTHFRSHRKIVTIDHFVSYIGGMNIGEKYANLDKIKNPWRDTQIRMEGNATLILDEYFLKDWLCSVKSKYRDKTIAYINSLKTPEIDHSRHICQFIVGGVDNNKEAIKMTYLSMIQSAKKKIRIQTPYFIPDASILDALKTKAATGVEIELMIPGVKASFFLDPVTTYYVGELLEYGAKIYKYKGYIHAKTMIIDDELVCIGSVNMDMRSLMVDDEVCGIFYDNHFVEKYSRIYDKDIESCNEYTKDEFLFRTRKEKVLESICLLFAPLM